MTSNACATLLRANDGPTEDGLGCAVATATRADGIDLLPLGAAEPELGPRVDRPCRAQARPRERIRTAVLPLVACAPRAPMGLGDRGVVCRHRRVPPAFRQRAPRVVG